MTAAALIGRLWISSAREQRIPDPYSAASGVRYDARALPLLRKPVRLSGVHEGSPAEERDMELSSCPHLWSETSICPRRSHADRGSA